MLELNNPKVLIRPNQAESAKEKNIIVGEGRSELSKSHQETPAKKVPENSLKNATLGGQEKNKDARSAQTGRSGNSGKNSRNNMKKEGRVLKNSWPNMRRKESSRGRGNGRTKLKIQIHHRCIVSNRLLMFNKVIMLLRHIHLRTNGGHPWMMSN